MAGIRPYIPVGTRAPSHNTGKTVATSAQLRRDLGDTPACPQLLLRQRTHPREQAPIILIGLCKLGCNSTTQHMYPPQLQMQRAPHRSFLRTASSEVFAQTRSGVLHAPCPHAPFPQAEPPPVHTRGRPTASLCTERMDNTMAKTKTGRTSTLLRSASRASSPSRRNGVGGDGTTLIAASYFDNVSQG